MTTAGGFPQLVLTSDVSDVAFDAVVVVTDDTLKLKGQLSPLKDAISHASELDKGIDKQPVLLIDPCVPSQRLIYSATGPVNRDYDDVRRFADAAQAGIDRAISAGSKSPLLITVESTSFDKAILVSVLGALHKTYLPLECAEAGKPTKIVKLGIWGNDGRFGEDDVKLATALEKGRIVARDIGGSDPERMAAPRVEEYVRETFQGSAVKVSVISDRETLKNDYPLLAAVDRAAAVVERHQARLLNLEYKGKGEIKKTLFVVGKGVTYDTGGADVKFGGNMAGMHRDKCGAAAVAGFMKVVSLLQPAHVRVVAAMAMVRNSIGEESYVADEIITSRAGVRVRVGNTDAEGRMAMGDVLCEMKERAATAVNPHIFTIATLTGHAKLAVGPAYSIIMDNGPASRMKTAHNIQETGDRFGDPFEVSTIRREDYDYHKGPSEYEDALQAVSNTPSSKSSRGHQGPGAFLAMVSGLDKHGVDSDQPLPFSHLDIAGAAGPFPGVPTGAPVVALSAHFLL